MNMIDYHKMKPTSDFIQDAAKVLGKVQQVFLPVDPNYWHVGLEVTEGGISTQKFKDDQRITLDLKTGLLKTPDVSRVLAEMSAQEIMQLLKEWLKSNDIQTEPAKPELVTEKPVFDNAQAKNILEMQLFSKKVLRQIKGSIKNGVTSPIFLFPHHFDLALEWYPDRQAADETDKKHQHTHGFSIGDENIPEPYYYAITYPDADSMKNRLFPEPAYWHTAGFTGAVLKYNDIAGHADPEKSVTSFFLAAL